MSDATVKESYFWKQVKQGLDDVRTDLCRIENTAGTGIFDVNACYQGVEAWVELKIFHGERLHFRNSQRSWAIRRHSVFGRLFVLARKDTELGGASIFLYKANDVFKATSRPASDNRSFSIATADLPPPIFTCRKPFNWPEIRSKIFEPADKNIPDIRD